MKFGVSETAKLLNIDKEILKKWSNIFSAYLSSSAVPQNGEKREYLIDDIRVFAYIHTFWEENPDIENIKYGLNSNSHYENPIIEDFVTSIIPFFQEFPEGIDETWRGVVFGGEFISEDLFLLADSYKLAGDRLVDIALDNYEERELFHPAIYNYRHSTELY